MILRPTLPSPIDAVHPPITTQLNLLQTKERASKISDANSSTNLPKNFNYINVRSDSPASLHTPSTMFPCQQHHNFNGNNTFPLEIQSIKCENISCLEFLIKLKSQQITKSISAKSLQKVDNLRTVFPVENKTKRLITFPNCLNIKERNNVNKLNETDKKFESLSYPKLLLSTSNSTTKLDLCNYSKDKSIENEKKLIFTKNTNFCKNSFEIMAKTTQIDSKLYASQTVRTTNCNFKQSLKFPLYKQQESNKIKTTKIATKADDSQTVAITNCDNKQSLKFPLSKQQECVTLLYYKVKEVNTTTLNEVTLNKLSHKTNINLQNLRNTNFTNDFNGLTKFPSIKSGVSAKNKKFPLKTTASQSVKITNSNNKQSLKFPLYKQQERNKLKTTEVARKPNASQTVTITNCNNKKSLKFPLSKQQERLTFLYYNYKKPKEVNKTTLNDLILNKLSHKTNINLQNLINTNFTNDFNDLTKFPLIKAGLSAINKKFPLKFHKINYSTNMNLKFKPIFPFKLKQNKNLFPCNIMKLNCRNENFEIRATKNLINNFVNSCASNNKDTLINLPFEKKIYKNFPLYVQNDVESFFIKQTNSIEDIQRYEFLKEQKRQQIPTHSLDGKTWNIINNSKTSLAQTTSRSMTHNLEKQNCQKSQKDGNEHASQVHVENPAAPAPPMAAAIANDDLRILPAINSKNNPQSSQMAKYTRNIEHNNDAIIIIASNDRACAPMLFENIVNSFSTNHKNELESFGSADGATEFASTPPMSVTSVQNTERTGSETKLEVHHIEHDLSDLCNSQVGQIVECSDVRDSLDKTVVDGAANLTSRTGSFLVKNQLPTSPAPLNSPIKQSDSVVVCTSHENYATSEILPNYYVLELCESNWPEIDHIKTTVNNHIQNENKVKEEQEEDIKSQIFVTETQTVKRANVLKEQVHEMTVTRLTDNEQEEPDAEELKAQLNEELDYKKNILIDDFKIDEMKFEMKSVKGALPSTASGRTRGKYDDNITANSSVLNNNGFSRNRPLRSSVDSVAAAGATTRNYISDTNNITALNSLRTDSNLPTNSISNRVSLNDYRNSNDSLITNLNASRPSLNALRNSNSTSILSVDLPRYTIATDSLGLPRPNVAAIDRATSIDTSLDNVLPERTRLRRQRRLRPQDSKDEPEDPIERLNLLKARISASLSEVKGVLKQYSTEENNDENPPATNVLQPLSSLKETKDEDNKDEGPVAFRFVKKIRRRSLFNEEEEEQKNHLLKTEANNIVDETDKSSLDNKQHNNNLITNDLATKIHEKDLRTLTKLPPSNENMTSEVSKANQQNMEIKANKLETKAIETNELKTKTEATAEEMPNIAKKLATRDVTPYPNKLENTENNGQVKEIEIEINQEKFKNTHLEKIHKTPKISKTNLEEELKEIDRNLYTLKEEIPKSLDDTKGAKPKETKPTEVTQKTKKKLNVKNKEPSRRSSLAAVEASKIEPPIKVAMPAKIQRRPSDSEAIVKKKLITLKTTTSGSVEEVTPKPKILKVKRSLQKKPTETRSEQLTTTPINNRDVLNKPTTDNQPQNKSINIDENKDALEPNAKTLEQQFNGETADSQNTKLLMPKQLEIDKNASLNEKSNENLMLPQQLQHSQQQEQQATNKSTATNRTSNELNRSIGDQGSGAMLDNLTTKVSSKSTTEANGQLNDKNRLTEDLHDLLQQDTAIVTIRPTNKNDLKATQTEIKDNIENKNKLTELEARPLSTADKQLEITQQQQQEQQPQVVESTQKLIVKNDEDVEDIIKTNDDDQRQPPTLTTAEEPTVSATTKTISSPQISISTTQDITEKTTTSTTEDPTQQANMPELKLTPAPVQTAGPDCQHHKKKVIVKKIIRQTSLEKAKKLEEISQKPEDKIEIPPEEDTNENEPVADDNTEESEYSTITELSEISESSASLPNEEAAEAAEAVIVPVKKERKIKKKVIIKRQKRRLSIGDTFFNHAEVEEPQIAEIETLEKAVAYFSDDEVDKQEEEAKKLAQDSEELKKPLKSCIMLKQYQIGDEVLYAERYKKTQVKWRRGRIKERITSISYMIDIEGKEISSHINYLKKYTGRKVNFGGKEYLEIDYEQLAEEEEKAEKLQRRSYSIWNMV